MNREVLFRGARVCDEKLVNGALVMVKENDESEKYIPNIVISYGPDTFDWFEVEPETVGQYTGIDDREGEKIFEGDIFKIGAENNIYTVRFDYGCFLAYEDDVQVGILAELSTMFIKKNRQHLRQPRITKIMYMNTERTLYEIEVALAKSEQFNYVKNIVAFNVNGIGSNLLICHECDMLVLSKSGYLTEIEIKRSWSDFIADLAKNILTKTWE